MNGLEFVNVNNLRVVKWDEHTLIFSTGDIFFQDFKNRRNTKVGYKDEWTHLEADNGRYVMISPVRFRGEVYLHRLIAKLFIPNPLNLPEVDHIDENKLNNNVSNLRWVTRQGNYRLTYTKNLQSWNEIKRAKAHKPVAVRATDESGNVRVWKSLNLAAKTLQEERGRGQVWSMVSNIKLAMETGRRSYGYYWEYIEN